MRSILLASVRQYTHAAIALRQAGILQEYICGILPQRGIGRLSGFLPRDLRNLLGRRLLPTELDTGMVHSISLPEILKEVLVRTHVASIGRSTWISCSSFDIIASLRVAPCDIFHFMCSEGLYSATKAKASGACLVCDARTEHPDFQQEILDSENSRLEFPQEVVTRPYVGRMRAEIDIADYLIVPSLFAKRSYVDRGFSADRIIVLPYGVDTNKYSPSPQTAKRFVVLFLGQVIARKGVHYLVEAFKAAHLSNAELRLVGRVGPEMRAYVTRWTREVKNLRVVGPVSQEGLIGEYQRASVLVMPSLADAFPLACLEALACGTPIIVSDNVGTKQLVEDGVTGFVVPIRDAKAISERLVLLYRNESLRQQFAASSRDIALRHSWETYREGLLRAYGQIAAREGIE